MIACFDVWPGGVWGDEEDGVGVCEGGGVSGRGVLLEGGELSGELFVGVAKLVELFLEVADEVTLRRWCGEGCVSGGGWAFMGV